MSDARRRASELARRERVPSDPREFNSWANHEAEEAKLFIHTASCCRGKAKREAAQDAAIEHVAAIMVAAAETGNPISRWAYRVLADVRAETGDRFPELGLVAKQRGNVYEVFFKNPRKRRSGRGSYPWEECMSDAFKRYGDEKTAKRVCGSIRAKSMARNNPRETPSTLKVFAESMLSNASLSVKLGNKAWAGDQGAAGWQGSASKAVVHWETALFEVKDIEDLYAKSGHKVPAGIAKRIRAIKDAVNRGGAKSNPAAHDGSEQYQRHGIYWFQLDDGTWGYQIQTPDGENVRRHVQKGELGGVTRFDPEYPDTWVSEHDSSHPGFKTAAAAKRDARKWLRDHKRWLAEDNPGGSQAFPVGGKGGPGFTKDGKPKLVEIEYERSQYWQPQAHGPSSSVIVSDGLELETGAGSSDDLSVYQWGNEYVVLAVNRQLEYASIFVFTLDGGKVGGDYIDEFDIPDRLGKRGLDLKETTIVRRMMEGLPY